jgi:hypothetical protein
MKIASAVNGLTTGLIVFATFASVKSSRLYSQEQQTTQRSETQPESWKRVEPLNQLALIGLQSTFIDISAPSRVVSTNVEFCQANPASRAGFAVQFMHVKRV